MSNEDKASKTEEATPKKRDEAAAEGNIAKSADIGVVFVLCATFTILVFQGKTAAAKIAVIASGLFSNIGNIDITQQSISFLMIQKFQDVFLVLLPLLGACTIAALAAGGLQTGFKLSPKALEPKLSRINIVNGLKNIVNTKKFTKGLGDLFKFSAVGWVIYGSIKEIANNEIFGSPVPLEHIGGFILATFIKFLASLLIIMGVIAAFDYLYQRRQINKDLMMTKEEIKNEQKDQSGNPQVKSAQKSMARRLLQKQMLNDVPLADVIVTNPTHYAVALKYESGKDLAPMVLAKGQNMFAQRIKEIAKKHNVPLVENKPVARLLFKVGEVGKDIPSGLYQVVAEILTEVYRTHKYYFHRLKARRSNHKND